MGGTQSGAVYGLGAIGAAIYKAAGVRMTSLPMSPPKVLHEILKK